MINFTILSLIILTVLLNTAAQLALKMGMIKIGHFDFAWHNLVPITLKIALSPWIFFGLLVYLISTATWLMVLSRIPVSIAYPMSSLGYVISAIAAYYMWHENLTPMRIAGITIILIGVYMMAKS